MAASLPSDAPVYTPIVRNLFAKLVDECSVSKNSSDGGLAFNIILYKDEARASIGFLANTATYVGAIVQNGDYSLAKNSSFVRLPAGYDSRRVIKEELEHLAEFSDIFTVMDNRVVQTVAKRPMRFTEGQLQDMFIR